MIAFRTTVAAEFLAGILVWGVTERSGQATPNQTLFVQNGTFITQVNYLMPASFRTRSQDEDDILGWVFFGLIIIVIVLMVVAAIAAVFIKYINAIELSAPRRGRFLQQIP